MADSEAPRIRLIGPAKALLVRTLLDHGLAGPADSRGRGPFPIASS